MEIKVAEKISAEEFSNMYFEDEDSFYYELMEGEIIRRGSPATMHQRILKKLLVTINAFVEGENLGEIFCAPLDVVLDTYNQLQPDLFFVSTAKKHIITANGIKGVPDLVIEILSPSLIMRDRIEKKRIYERNGAQEYWLVSPEYSEIEIFVLENSRYEIFSAATVLEGTLKSKMLDGLILNFVDIFNS